jgi:hypothetical protein
VRRRILESNQGFVEPLPVPLPQGTLEELPHTVADESQDLVVGAFGESHGSKGPIHGKGGSSPVSASVPSRSKTRSSQNILPENRFMVPTIGKRRPVDKQIRNAGSDA